MTDDELRELQAEAEGSERAYHSETVARLAAELLTLRAQSRA